MTAAGTGSIVRAVTALLLVTTSGCGGGGSGYGPDDNPTTVRDTTGVVFAWNCGSSGCQVGLTAETPAPDPCGGGDRAAYSYTWGRFFSICSVCVPTDSPIYWSTSPGQCRLLACDTSADCPVIYQYAPASVYECVNGLCENADQNEHPRTPLVRSDAEELCFTTIPRSETSNPFFAAAQQVEADLDASCTGNYPMDTCTLPGACRAP